MALRKIWQHDMLVAIEVSLFLGFHCWQSLENISVYTNPCFHTHSYIFYICVLCISLSINRYIYLILKCVHFGSWNLLFDRQPCLPAQCQPQPWDTMLKIRVNGFVCTGCLVTRAAFYSGKVDVVAISDPFIDLNYMVYTFQYDSTHASSKAQSKLRTGSLSSMESPSPSSRSEILPTSNEVMLVLNMLWSQLVSSLPWRRLGLTWRVESRGLSFLPLLRMPPCL